MRFKYRLKQLRGERGITQEQLAEQLDIPASTIRRLESDEDSLPRRDRLEAIANYFNCSVDYLMGRTNNKKSTSNSIDRNKSSITEMFLNEIITKYNLDLSNDRDRKRLETLVELFMSEYKSNK